MAQKEVNQTRPPAQPSPKAKEPPAPRPRPAAPAPETPPARGERLVRLVARFQRFGWDFAGVICLALTLMTLLALLLPRLAEGALLSWWVGLLQVWFGWGSVWLVSVGAIAGLWMLRRNHASDLPKILWGRVLALEAGAFASLALLAVLGGSSLERAGKGLDGGRIGWGLSELLRLLMSPAGLGGAFWRELVLWAILVASILVVLGAPGALAAWVRKTARQAYRPGALAVEEGPVVSEGPIAVGGAPQQEERKKKRQVLPPEFRQNLPSQPAASPPSAAPPPRDERLPPLDLLSGEQASRPDERHINLTAGLIVKTLAEFGIPAKVVGYRVGPTVTQFAVEPGFVEKEKPGNEGELARMKVRVAQISALQRDLTLALAAERLRIEAPVPGRPYVGIEVPNSRSTVVRLRPILESDAFYNTRSPLAIGLGRDVSGQPVVADLARMPHLLVAGTTGSGKSVCIAALTTCLVMNNPPEELRLVMIDPKMVELVRFNGLPHLLGKVETELERILAVLRWTVAEMDRRYKLLEYAHARNIDSYNRKAGRKKGATAGLRPGAGPLPRIVVMVDELADLMMSAPDQTEHNLVRLAQMARAVGIHLVVATQRPSTDVVTGLIKANFPARISFTVASSIDSRVILDTQGAESLLGRGDMLFLPPEAAGPVRSQGAMVTDQEIERVITYWQKAAPPAPEAQAEKSPWDQMIEEEATLADRDGLVERATALVKQTQRASASLLQRRLHIGYPRAARLIDELEELGVIGPASSGREREVLVAPDEDGGDPSDEYDEG